MEFLRKNRASANIASADESGRALDSDRKFERKSAWGISTIMAGPDLGRASMDVDRKEVASLVDGGRHAGKTRVRYEGHNLQLHLLTRDFFITVIGLKTRVIVMWVFVIYLASFFLWSIPYYLIVRFYPGCIYGASTYVESWTFAFITQMTIGYGNTGPQQCWAASWVIVIQAIFAVLLEAVTLGIIFSRISHPAQRGRSIFISSNAIMARRDGILKFMFRVADIRNTQVVEPKVRAFLYTWGEGRTTAEGERIPVRCEELDIGYIDGMLILPLIIEHTVDERSPLCGHTLDSLMALSAEVVVTFEGTTEFGNPFMARRSYLPQDIYWGYQFTPIICRPMGDDTTYTVKLEYFHDVEPQVGLPPLPPSQLSQLVVNRAKRTVPYPLLGENTLVLSDCVCIAPNEQGALCLYCRCADTYPNQMLEITVRMYLYRWVHPSEAQDPSRPAFKQMSLECGYESGTDRLYLRLPTEVTHEITDDSPIASWRTPQGMLADKDSELVVVVQSYLNLNGQNRMRQRTYSVGHHVRYGFRFFPIVRHPSQSRDNKPRVRWNRFHDVVHAEDMPHLPPSDAELPLLPQGTATQLEATPPPESHRGRIAQFEVQRLKSQNWRGRGAVSAGSSQRSLGADGLGPLPDGSAAAAAADALEPEFDGRNDYTVVPMDLQRYAATTEDMDHTLMKMHVSRRSPLPDFAAVAAAAAAAGASSAGSLGGQSRGRGGSGESSVLPASPTNSAADGRGRGSAVDSLRTWKRMLSRDWRWEP